MNDQGIIHLCNVKEVAPSKRLNSKSLIYLLYLFLSWVHNTIIDMKRNHGESTSGNGVIL